MNTRPVRMYVVREWADVLSATFTLIRQNWRVLGKALLLYAAPLVGIGAALVGYFQLNMFNLLGTSGGVPVNFGALGFGMLAAILTNLAGITFAIALSMAAVALHEEHGPGNFTIEQMWREARSQFARVVGVVTLAGLAMIPGFFLMIIPCLGILAFMGLLVYLGVGFSLVFAAVHFEDAGVIEGYRRSWALVRDHWWPTAGVVVLAGLVFYMIVGALSAPAYVAMMVTMFSSLETGDFTFSPLYVVFIVIASVGSTIFYPIPLVATALQYGSLVERKERRGLAERVAALRASVGAGPVSAPPPLPPPGPTTGLAG